MFDQDHGLIQPFTVKDNSYLIANSHQNNSNDVFIFSLQSRSRLRSAEQRKLSLTVLKSFFCIEGMAAIRNLFCLLFDVYLPRGVCSSRLILQVSWASQVVNFL